MKSCVLHFTVRCTVTQNAESHVRCSENVDGCVHTGTLSAMSTVYIRGKYLTQKLHYLILDNFAPKYLIYLTYLTMPILDVKYLTKVKYLTIFSRRNETK